MDPDHALHLQDRHRPAGRCFVIVSVTSVPPSTGVRSYRQYVFDGQATSKAKVRPGVSVVTRAHGAPPVQRADVVVALELLTRLHPFSLCAFSGLRSPIVVTSLDGVVDRHWICSDRPPDDNMQRRTMISDELLCQSDRRRRVLTRVQVSIDHDVRPQRHSSLLVDCARLDETVLQQPFGLAGSRNSAVPRCSTGAVIR